MKNSRFQIEEKSLSQLVEPPLEATFFSKRSGLNEILTFLKFNIIAIPNLSIRSFA